MFRWLGHNLVAALGIHHGMLQVSSSPGEGPEGGGLSLRSKPYANLRGLRCRRVRHVVGDNKGMQRLWNHGAVRCRRRDSQHGRIDVDSAFTNVDMSQVLRREATCSRLLDNPLGWRDRQ